MLSSFIAAEPHVCSAGWQLKFTGRDVVMLIETLLGQTAGLAGRRAGGLSNKSLEHGFDQTYNLLPVYLGLGFVQMETHS